MPESTSSPSIFRALAAVMADVRGVAKDGRNQQQGFNFRGIDAVLNAVGPALRKHGVFVAPTIVDHTAEVVEVGQKKTPMKSVTVTATYTFFGPAGDSVTSTVIGEAMDSGDKAFSKAMSVAMRTVLIQTLCLPTDEKDPDQEVYERAPRDPGEPLRQPPQQQRGGNGQNGNTQKPLDKAAQERRDAWTEAWNAAKALNMSREEFASDFNGEFGVSPTDGTVAQLRQYAQQQRQAAEAGAAA